MTRIRYWLSQRLWWLAFAVAPSVDSFGYPFEYTDPKEDEFDSGYATGYRRGREHGLDEGFDEGFFEGREEGWEAGFEEGQSLERIETNDVPDALPTPTNEELMDEAFAGYFESW